MRKCSKKALVVFPSALLILLVLPISQISAVEAPLKIFGYFQTEFRHDSDSGVNRNSFLMQQLNLFFQKDLGDDWTSFVNFEIVNSYSSLRDWGSFNLEEAWAGYRSSEQLKFKAGLQIPEFNNFNTIKNRSPLMPYIIRPLVYETSFGEFINLDFMVPTRAYVQVYGAVPVGGLKVDHAAYLGNSPNVRTAEQVRTRTAGGPSQSGVDTTNTFMFGGRVGLRYSGLKTGFSATHEKFNGFVGLSQVVGFFAADSTDYNQMPLTRIGADLSYYWRGFSVESEYLKSKIYRKVLSTTEIGAEFYYVTLGCNINEKLFLYASYSQLEINDIGIEIDSVRGSTPYGIDVNVELPSVGFSYTYNNRITFKGQALFVEINERGYDIVRLTERYKYLRELNRFAVAVSAFF
jgi:hypothetical protein